QVVDHRINDLQAAAMLGRRWRRLVGESSTARPLTAARIDHLDDTPTVPRAHLDLILLTGTGVLYDVGTGLAEGEGNVSAGVRRNANGCQAAVENLAGYRHADRFTGK